MSSFKAFRYGLLIGLKGGFPRKRFHIKRLNELMWQGFQAGSRHLKARLGG